jgi:hypothetical protein
MAGLLALMLGAAGHSQGSALEGEIRDLFLQEDSGRGDSGPTYADMPNIFRKFGNDGEIVTVLTELASKNKHAEAQSPELMILKGSVAILGEFKAASANELLIAVLTDRQVPTNARALAARSLGQIDAEKNKQILLGFLGPSEDRSIRIYAAEALAKTNDSAALAALERIGSEERDSPSVRQRFEKAAQELRDKGVKPN